MLIGDMWFKFNVLNVNNEDETLSAKLIRGMKQKSEIRAPCNLILTAHVNARFC